MQGDADLDTEFGFVPGSLLATEDTTYLEFDFQLDPAASQDLYFNFVFASEEYNEFANTLVQRCLRLLHRRPEHRLHSRHDDADLDQHDQRREPAGHNPQNPQFYNNNSLVDNGQFLNLLGYDGFTEVFTAQALGIGPGTHTIKLAISDV